MSRNSLPWHRRYHGDWLLSERRAAMSLAQRGLYVELLDRLYVGGSLPDDEAALARLVGVPLAEFSEAWQVVREEFESDPNQPGRLVQAEVLVALATMDEYVCGQAEKGRKSGRSRKAASEQRLSNGSNSGSTTVPTTVEQAVEQRLNDKTRLDKNKNKKDQTPCSPSGERRACFDAFWTQYPRKVAKRDAIAAFSAVIKTSADERLLSETLPAWVIEFQSRDPDKVPYPATFLRKGQWSESPPKREHKPSGVSAEIMEIARSIR